jgi:protein-disulfide isomerase/uncharacterized membrane protein
MRRGPWIALSLLGLLASANSIWLYILQGDLTSFGAACHVAPGFDCAPALQSRYGQVFGISLSSYAVVTYIFFTLLGIQPLFERRFADRNALALVVLSFFGSIYCAWLAWVSRYVLRAICPFCTVLHILTPLILIFSLVALSRRTKSIAGIIREEAGSILGDKRLLFGLVAAGLALAIGIPWLNHLARERLLDAQPMYREVLEGRYPRYEALVEELGERPWIGPDDAAVTLVEFSDFLCPVCRQSRLILKELADQHELRYLFVPHPRSSTCNPYAEYERPIACLAALVAKYAERTGRYWPVHDALFDRPALLHEENADELARLAGAPTMAAILADTTAAIALARDIELANRIGVRHTPAIFINGMGMEGLPDDWFLRDVVRRELKRGTAR